MIVGAGFAGLIAAHVLPQHKLCDASPGPKELHKAVLRFRSKVVSDVTGIPFRPVTLHKGIWSNGDWRIPNIALANSYAKKVVGAIVDRSIWSIETSTRYIAPHDFYERLIDAVGARIDWGMEFDPIFNDVGKEGVISTAPMPATIKSISGYSALDLAFQRSPIHVARYHVPGADVFQTVYFPDEGTPLYRASITGDLLICEFVERPIDPAWELLVGCAFGLSRVRIEPLGDVDQEYGKIVPVDEGKRKEAIIRMTNELGVYSLGRFATWRNILLDDVVQDAQIVKRLLTQGEYNRKIYYKGGL